MFDDRRGGLGELADESDRRIEIEKVRVRRILALQQPPGTRSARTLVQRGTLMGILSVPQISQLPELNRHAFGRHRRGRRADERRARGLEAR